jgi:hypothetical protein
MTEHDRGCSVPEVMETDHRQAGHPGQSWKLMRFCFGSDGCGFESLASKAARRGRLFCRVQNGPVSRKSPWRPVSCAIRVDQDSSLVKKRPVSRNSPWRPVSCAIVDRIWEIVGVLTITIIFFFTDGQVTFTITVRAEIKDVSLEYGYLLSLG